MAWYPGATRMELQPESDTQPAIRPTQLIVHSIVGPWTARRTYEYWRDSTSLESHFGLGYAGDLAQYIGTETRADANAAANRRADGTGAVSIETASNTSASDPWTDEQVEQLIRLGVWMHQWHDVPLRVCRTHDDPGFGYHRLHREWSTSGTACPGDARVAQWHAEVFPGILARATGTSTAPQEDEMPTAEEIAAAVWQHTVPVRGSDLAADSVLRRAYTNALDGNRGTATLTAQVGALTAAVTALAQSGGLDVVEVQAAAEAGARAALAELGAALIDEG